MNNNEPSSNTQVLYGTNINSTEVQQKLRNFITSFTVINDDEEDFAKEPLYVEQLKLVKDTECFILDVNCDHIYEYD